MKLGIIGLPQTGKKFFFELLTGNQLSPDTYDANKPIPGVAEIRDQRFYNLVEMYNPKKEAPARIDIQLLPKIENNTIKEGAIFKDIANIDAVCHIVRAFNDDSVFHVDGSVNPVRDIEKINSELILHDLLFIEKRLEKISLGKKKKNEKSLEIEENVMIKFRDHLENDLHLRTLEISEDEEKIIMSYPFITRKEMLIVLNVDDSELNNNDLMEKIISKCKSLNIKVLQISAKVESEIASLEDEEEKNEFMEAVGINEPALYKLTEIAMKSLGLISFFTVGKDEVKQWLVRNGSNAPEAGRVIHTDIQRGFIRAEVMKYQDLIDYKNEEEIKKAGKLYIMGKDYIVEDGEIISFRFNV